MMLSKKTHRSFSSIIFTLFFFLLAGLSTAAYALHFPDPAVHTPYSANFYGTVKINGQAAQQGDEVAFFDPQEVLCGHYVIASTDVGGSYGFVAVYGDEPGTPLDEGAVSGDVLTVKIWDSRAGQELEGNALLLSTTPIWQSMGSTILNIETATHFPKPVVTPSQGSDYIGKLTIKGEPAGIGDEIAVFDPNGVLCGLFIVSVPGQYGIMHIYSDDHDTPVDEGAEEGDILTFKMWDRRAGIEYSGNSLVLSPGQSIGSFIASEPKPIWTENVVGYVLDIAVQEKGDLSADGSLDLSDVIMALQVLTGQPPSGLRQDYVTSKADVEGNSKIGLAEAIYSLQRLARIRP